MCIYRDTCIVSPARKVQTNTILILCVIFIHGCKDMVAQTNVVHKDVKYKERAKKVCKKNTYVSVDNAYGQTIKTDARLQNFFFHHLRN